MSKIIHINEDAYNRTKPLPFLSFFEEIVSFLKGLLNDPIGTTPSETLNKYGFDNSHLRKILLDYNIITKKENITEPFDETTGKLISKYSVSYRVPKANFKDKIRKLYNDTFNGKIAINNKYVS